MEEIKQTTEIPIVVGTTAVKKRGNPNWIKGMHSPQPHGRPGLGKENMQKERMSNILDKFLRKVEKLMMEKDGKVYLSPEERRNLPLWFDISKAILNKLHANKVEQEIKGSYTLQGILAENQLDGNALVKND